MLVLVISDPLSFKRRKDLLRLLRSDDLDLADLGVLSEDDETTDEELAAIAAARLGREPSACCLALSISGNTFNILGNKHPNVRAVPCADETDAHEGVALYDANLCDLRSGLPIDRLLRIAKAFLAAYSRAGSDMALQ